MLRQSLVAVGQDFRADHTVRLALLFACFARCGAFVFDVIVCDRLVLSELAAYCATSAQAMYADHHVLCYTLALPWSRCHHVGGWGAGAGGDGRCIR